MIIALSCATLSVGKFENNLLIEKVFNLKVFTRDYRITGSYHPLWDDYFGDLSSAVFDIETTGLSPSRCKVVLTGFLTRTDSGVRVTQFLAENHYEEQKVLDASMDFLEKEGISCLITYNGASFDVPFMNTRLDCCFTGRRLGIYDFDLYRFLRMNSDLGKRIGSLSQKSVENYFGILEDRGDTITGRESVMLFDQYAISGNSTIEKIILTHNREDVLHLHRLMYAALAEVHGMHEADGGLHSAFAAYGFPAAGGRLSLRPRIKKASRAKYADGILCINGEQLSDQLSCAYFPDMKSPVTAVFNSGASSLEISAPVSFRGDDSYMDISFIEHLPTVTAAANKTAGIEELRSDPDCVNDYLILNPRTINLISRILAEYFV